MLAFGNEMSKFLEIFPKILETNDENSISARGQ